MEVRAAELAGIDHERRGEAHQRLYWREDHLLARHWLPRYQRSVLITRLADCQVQIVLQASHAERLVPRRHVGLDLRGCLAGRFMLCTCRGDEGMGQGAYLTPTLWRCPILAGYQP